MTLILLILKIVRMGKTIIMIVVVIFAVAMKLMITVMVICCSADATARRWCRWVVMLILALNFADLGSFRLQGSSVLLTEAFRIWATSVAHADEELDKVEGLVCC